MNKRALLLLAATILCASSAACGPAKGYPGPTRDSSELVLIRPNPYWTNISTTVRSVDGMPVNAQVELAILPGTRTLQLTLAPYTMQYIRDNPGPFAAHANWSNLQQQSQVTITYDFALGTEYALAGASQKGLFTLWVQPNQLDAEKLKTWNFSSMTVE